MDIDEHCIFLLLWYSCMTIIDRPLCLHSLYTVLGKRNVAEVTVKLPDRQGTI